MTRPASVFWAGSDPPEENKVKMKLKKVLVLTAG